MAITPTGTEGVFKSKITGEEFLFGDPNRNVANILGQDLQFVRGQDIGAEQRQAYLSRFAPTTITGDALSPTTGLPYVGLEVSPPTDISGLQPAELKLTGQEVKQTTLEKELERLQSVISERPAFEEQKRAEFGVSTAQQALDDLNTQLRDLQRQQQLVPLTIQQQSVGRGRTEAGIEPLEIGRRRALAYDALTTASLIDAAQGRLASAERKVNDAIREKFAPLEARERAIMANLKMVKDSPETSIQDKNRAIKQEALLKARIEANEAAKLEAKNILSWATKAAENMAKQGTLNAVVLNEIKNAETEEKAFELAAPYLAIPKEATTGALSDFEAAFQRQHGRLPNVDELTAFKRSTQVTYLTASGQLDRVLTPAEQQLYGSPAGTRLSEIQGQVPIAPAQREKLTSFTQALPIVEAIKNMAGQLNLADTTAGTILRGARLKARSLLPATAEGQYEAQKRSFLTLLSRAAGERGVVTDQDVNRIAGNIPGFFDTKKSAQAKLGRFADILKEVQARAAAGYIGNPLNQSSPTNQLDPLGLF